jgi:hypothetical protein
MGGRAVCGARGAARPGGKAILSSIGDGSGS